MEASPALRKVTTVLMASQEPKPMLQETPYPLLLLLLEDLATMSMEKPAGPVDKSQDSCIGQAQEKMPMVMVRLVTVTVPHQTRTYESYSISAIVTLTIFPLIKIPLSPQRKICPPAGVKTTNSTATARKPNVEGSSEPTYYTKVAALNPDLDRSPAVHGEPMPEKMKVQYELPHTKNIKRLYFRQYNNGRSFDWNNIEHIRVLNRWRAQVFR